jgi:glycosidase
MRHNKILITTILFGASCLFSLSSCQKGYKIVEADNSQGSVGYEIFVGGYKDSDGDTKGDLQGVTSKLSYLHDLGVKRVWFMPIMKSKSYHKYNVDDYYSIDPTYGTLDDFDTLVSEAKKQGISVIIDLVLNHSSDDCYYFQKSAAAKFNGTTGGYDDWYVWSKTAQDGYHYSATARAYYESRFDATMPEFNLDNLSVRAEIQKIVDFWLGHGVEGFRLDATTYYYYENISKNVEFLTWLHDYVKSKKSDAYIVGEAWKTSQEVISQYAKSGIRFFNFPTAELNNDGPAAALTLNDAFYSFPYDIQDAQTRNLASSSESEPCIFVTNHDQTRWGNYFSNFPTQQAQVRKLCVNMYLLTPGTPWMYYGEELAMLGVKKSNTDSPLRTGMIWGNGETRCAGPENFDDSSYQVKTNVSDSLKDGYSLLNHYRQVIAIRNAHNDLFEKGLYAPYKVSGATKANGFTITYDSHTYYLIHNADKATAKIDVPSSLTITANVPSEGTDASLSGNALSLPAFSSVLLG